MVIKTEFEVSCLYATNDTQSDDSLISCVNFVRQFIAHKHGRIDQRFIATACSGKTNDAIRDPLNLFTYRHRQRLWALERDIAPFGSSSMVVLDRWLLSDSYS